MSAIYRDWDQATLDAELNLRARWPEHAEIFQRWAADSRTVRGRQRTLSDLAYGPSAGERLDLFPVPGAERAPLLAFVHGGYWQSLDKAEFSYLAPPLVERGVAFAALNYDLAPKAPIGEMLAQIRRALVWLHDQAGRYGVDPDRVFVAGHSAGGHLALLAAGRDWAGAHGAPADLVKGAVSISGVYDLQPVRLSYHNAVLELDRDTAEALSPLRRVPQRAAPLLAAVGGEETREFRWQQDDLLAAWRGAGLGAASVDLPGRNHFDALDALGEPAHPLFDAVLRLIARGDLG